jgi:streptogramin lyase
MKRSVPTKVPPASRRQITSIESCRRDAGSTLRGCARLTNHWLIAIAFALCIGRLAAQDSVSTFAGSALVTGAADGPRTNALFSDPADLAIAPDGTIYVADSANHTIRRIATNGLVSTFAGAAGTNGFANGPGADARFDSPTGLALDTAGNLLVADTGNHTVRRITPTGVVNTLAGFAGESGFSNAVGTNARFNSPLGVCVASNGTVFVSDSGNHCIRAIAPGGAVSTFAGTPEDWGAADGPAALAKFNNPVGLAFDTAGDLFIADANNHTIRRVGTNGVVTTFAGEAGVDGFADGDGAAARFTKPAELAFDAGGGLLVADSFNHLVRRVTPAGVVGTLTGGQRADGSADGVNRAARFFNPYGLAVAPGGAVLVTDTYNATVRRLLSPVAVTIRRAGGQVELHWNSVAGERYQVEFRELAGADWLPLAAAFEANEAVSTMTDATDVGRLYRVRVLP